MIALAALVAAGVAAPQVPPPAAHAPGRASSILTPIDPAALAAARRLMAESDIQGQLRAIFPQVIDVVVSQARARFKDGAMPAGLSAELEQAMRAELSGMADVFTPAVQDQMAAAYARHFSAAELDRIAGLMADPAMVRFRQETPALMHDLLPVVMAAVSPRQHAFQQRVTGIIADWIRAHPEDRSQLVQPLPAAQP